MSRFSQRCVAPLLAVLVASLGLFAATAEGAQRPSEPQRMVPESDSGPGTPSFVPSPSGHGAAAVRPASAHAPATVAKSVPVVVPPGGSLAWLAIGVLGPAPWLGSVVDPLPRTYVRRRGPPTLLPA